MTDSNRELAQWLEHQYSQVAIVSSAHILEAEKRTSISSLRRRRPGDNDRITSFMVLREPDGLTRFVTGAAGAAQSESGVGHGAALERDS